MKAPLLLDTCAVIWIAIGQPIASEADEAIQEALHAGVLAFVSPITAWEIGLLVSRGRVRLNTSPQLWFDRMMPAPELLPEHVACELSSSSLREIRRATLPTVSWPRQRANMDTG